LRDIHGALDERIDMFAHQISIENARFEQLIQRLKREYGNRWKQALTLPALADHSALLANERAPLTPFAVRLPGGRQDFV
jgi:hypothetical protein